MTLRLSSPRRNRRAFTVVEMIVVITIILTLIGMLMGGISAAWNKAKEAEVRQQISQVSEAITAFKSAYPTRLPPTHLVLASNYAAVASPAADNATGFPFGTNAYGYSAEMKNESEQFLKSMFTRWNPSPNGSNGLPVPQGQVRVLSGSQVLTFLLGGYSGHGSAFTFTSDYAGQGFSDDPAWPFGNPNLNPATNPKPSRKAPFIDLSKAKSTVAVLHPKNPGGDPTAEFPALADTFGMPLAYVASKGNNEYAYSQTGNALGGASYIRISAVGAAQTIRVDPFSSTTGVNAKYYNPSGFQIVSAGKDAIYWLRQPLKGGGLANGGFGPVNGGQFTTGGQWTPGQGINYVLSGPSYDNICNFHGRLMGIP